MIDNNCDETIGEVKATSIIIGTLNMNLHDNNTPSEHEDYRGEVAATTGGEHLPVDSIMTEDPIGGDDRPETVSSSSVIVQEVVSSDIPLELVNTSPEEKERLQEETSIPTGGIVNPQDDNTTAKSDDVSSPLPQDKETEDVAFPSRRRLSWAPSPNLYSIDATDGDEDVAIAATKEERRSSTSSMDTDFLSRRNSMGSNSSYSLDKKDSIWTRLAKRSDVWEDNEEDYDEGNFSCKKFCKNLYVEEVVSIKAKWNLLKAHPRIGIIGIVSFIIFCASSCAVILTFNKHYNQHNIDEAEKTAEDLVHRFEDQLTTATLPLFSIAEFVKDLPYFTELPYEIGPGGEEGSAPFTQDNPTFRNVSGICDNNITIENFDRLANNMKQSADLNGILLQLQLAPEGVVCLIHPKNNTDDFSPPLYLDGSYLIGQDTLADPFLRGVAQQTLSTNDTINIDGPFAVQACHTSDTCPIAVQNAFIARLPIIMPGHNMSINGSTYPTWGFASELINGDALVERAFADYKLHGSQYRLIKIKDGEVYVLKQSPDADKVTVFQNVSFKTLNGQWIAQVGYAGVSLPPWLGGVIVAALLISILLSWMLMLIFFEKLAHQDLLKEMLPRKALKKIQRGETVVEKYSMVTVFFCDIVGYTSISADMRPIQVMKLLNTYYNEVDKLASKHKVFKIETIGDSYMCVGGCPERCLGSEAAEHVALFALELVELVKNFSTEDGMQIVIRAGMNSGPVVAGVVGTNRPQYTVFGDAVNAAARMETTSEKMKIQCSEMSYRLLRDSPNYQFSLSERGNVEVKGKGRMQTWFIDSASKRVLDDTDKTVEAEASSSTGIVNSVGGDSADLGY